MTCKCFARCEADCVCDHDWTPPAVIALRAEVERLRAELAMEHKRQASMRTLIASLEAQLSHYRSKQVEADEAVRTLDSERAANATLTAELAACREALSDMVNQFFLERDDGTISHSFMSAEEHAISYLLQAGLAEEVSRCRYRLIDAARKGEGDV